MHQKTAWDAAIDRGVVKGELHVLLKLGRQRLGDPDAEIEATLAAIQDAERLDRMTDVMLKVKSWKALLP